MSASGSGGHFVVGGDSCCSTPFFSAPTSPARDAPFLGGFFSAPTSPVRGVPVAGDEYGCEFEFGFSSRFPSPAAAPMSSADELFHNGQIRPMRLASFLVRSQPLPALDNVPAGNQSQSQEAAGDERGRLRSQSVHRRSRSHSPFRTHWLSPSPSSSRALGTGHASVSDTAAAPSASRSSSSSSSSTASSASSSSSRSSHRWRFLKDLLHRSRSDNGKNPPPPSPPPPPKTRNPSPAAAARGRGGRRKSVHERLYASRRAEVEEMRRRTFLPYQQGLLLGCLGLSSRSYGAMHGLSAAAKSRS
ncbi:hypothetical protein GUJ93_ZPchr0009g347 [Zizania palustris]|uniref:Calmodulin-binding protein n=1 Tax=Zizania palustris TaxID=103762 RepID=A0A8J5RMR0_ZIZPA|nr:hypothetical protein GUJ93_ZPchr0009g347 [Zizania palustris]